MGTPPSDAMVTVWDRPVRLLHALLALSVATCWLAGEAWLPLHEAAGYVALVTVAVRTVWGCVGSPAARFTRFVRGPRATWRYLLSQWQAAPSRHLGHNPLGGWMTVALLLTVAATGVSGWLFTWDRFWGLAWLEWLHRVLAWAVLGLVGLHIGGVLLTSRRQRENLPLAIVTGRKRRARPDAVDAAHFPLDDGVAAQSRIFEAK